MGKNLARFYPLSNVEINGILAHKLGSSYKGCHARNALPLDLENGYYVLNLDDKSSEGTHWVGLKVDQKQIVYFDSFGFICPNEILARRRRRKIWYSSHEIQSTNSVACGFYVIYFLTELFNGRDKNEILLDFKNDGSIENDRKLKDLMSE